MFLCALFFLDFCCCFSVRFTPFGIYVLFRFIMASIMDVSHPENLSANVAWNACSNMSSNVASDVVAGDVGAADNRMSDGNVSDGSVGSRSGQFNINLEDSYAQRAARTVGRRDAPRHYFSSPIENNMQERPKTAFFTPSKSATARSVFAALKSAEIDAANIQCVQRKMNGEVVITFKDTPTKEKFLSLNSLTVNNESYALQDIDRPLSFLTIFDAPFELSDFAIIKRLAPYCDVISYRRGKFDFVSGVYNGLRHYRVCIIKPIPNFLRFGKYQIFLKYDGQLPTCRRCNQPGHFVSSCPNKVCFNCENVGHESCNCPAPPLCCLCRGQPHGNQLPLLVGFPYSSWSPHG